MSLKAVELQIAIPKTFEAGKIAEQKHQQTQLHQDLATSRMEQHEMKTRETVLESGEYAKLNADGENPKGGNSPEEERRNKEEEKKTAHPYKGAFVDFTG